MKEECWTCDRQQAAEILGESTKGIERYEAEGRLHRLPLHGVKYNRREVYRMAGEKDSKAVDRWRMAALEAENERLKKENATIKAAYLRVVSLVNSGLSLLGIGKEGETA